VTSEYPKPAPACLPLEGFCKHMVTFVEEGTVVAVFGKECVVRLRGEEGDRCRKCGLCQAAAQEDDRRRILRLAVSEPVQVGMTVRVEVRQPNSAALAMVLFGLPMAGAAAGAVIGGAGAGLIGWPQWIGVLVGAVAGLLVAARIVWATERRWKAKGAFTPRMVSTSDAVAQSDAQRGQWEASAVEGRDRGPSVDPAAKSS